MLVKCIGQEASERVGAAGRRARCGNRAQRRSEGVGAVGLLYECRTIVAFD